jgi:hypothetical protein
VPLQRGREWGKYEQTYTCPTLETNGVMRHTALQEAEEGIRPFFFLPCFVEWECDIKCQGFDVSRVWKAGRRRGSVTRIFEWGVLYFCGGSECGRYSAMLVRVGERVALACWGEYETMIVALVGCHRIFCCLFFLLCSMVEMQCARTRLRY